MAAAACDWFSTRTLGRLAAPAWRCAGTELTSEVSLDCQSPGYGGPRWSDSRRRREGNVTTTASDLLFDRLIDWGVDTIFGLPGDGINGLMESLRERRDKIKFIHVRHEEAA